MGKTLTWWILGALALGLVAGFLINTMGSAETIKDTVYYLGIVTDLFLRLIKMIIAPLVFAALVSGIGHMGGDAKALGRIGGRALAWFVGASFVSIIVSSCRGQKAPGVTGLARCLAPKRRHQISHGF